MSDPLRGTPILIAFADPIQSFFATIVEIIGDGRYARNMAVPAGCRGTTAGGPLRRQIRRPEYHEQMERAAADVLTPGCGVSHGLAEMAQRCPHLPKVRIVVMRRT